jgi:hypothetical protein
MTDYTFQYRLQSAPSARNDGSGCVDHDIYAESQPVGDGGYVVIPGRHKTISIPADELAAALAAGTNPQVIAAYKDALADNLNTQPVPLSGWSAAQLEALMDANDAASTAATDADEFITVTLGETYPLSFII